MGKIAWILFAAGVLAGAIVVARSVFRRSGGVHGERGAARGLLTDESDLSATRPAPRPNADPEDQIRP